MSLSRLCPEGAAADRTHACGQALPLPHREKRAAQYSDIFLSCSFSTETLDKARQAKARDEV